MTFLRQRALGTLISKDNVFVNSLVFLIKLPRKEESEHILPNISVQHIDIIFIIFANIEEYELEEDLIYDTQLGRLNHYTYQKYADT